MKESTSREQILKRIRQALIQQNPKPYPELEGNVNVMNQGEEELSVQFAEQFAANHGYFIYCEKEEELGSNLQQLVEDKHLQYLYCYDTDIQERLTRAQFSYFQTDPNIEEADAGITGCESLVARTGSILISSGQQNGRYASIYPPVHIVIATTQQLVADISDGFTRLRTKYGDSLPSMISLTTGPSQTADIEKTLVLGAHGPKELYLFLIEEV